MLSLLLSLGPLSAVAAAPTGNLDVADGTHVAGWARDDDYAGPIAVHVYIDGAIVQGTAADLYRSDVGDHAFDWYHEPFGAGDHEVIVYAIGVDSAGVPDGENVALSGAPATFNVGCSGLSGHPFGWCEGNADYWEERQSETVYVGDSAVRAGVNPSYGGTIFQLYDDDWTQNLLLEHGGGAVQLSIWGYHEVGSTGFFGLSWCDSTPYASDADCLAAGHSSCVARAWGEGDHVANCSAVEACVGWSAGAPWNPIQAQGSDCGWADSGNDGSQSWSGDALVVTQSSPRHFTKSGAGVSGLTFQRTVTPGTSWVRLDDRIAYDGGYTWGEHDQEVPAIFTAHGVDATFYWYEGDAPYTDAASAVSSTTSPVAAVLALPGTDSRSSFPEAGTTSERWWSVCDTEGDRCMTVASFERDLIHASLQAEPGGGAYLTAMSRFNLAPGYDETWTTYLFPYRYDVEVGGQTVREAIFELAAAAGCSAEVACNGIDEDCTGADLCGGGDSGAPGDSGSTSDTGGSVGPGDSGGDSGEGGAGEEDTGFSHVIATHEDEDDAAKSTGCAAAGGSAGGLAWASIILLRRRRRVSRG